MIPKIMCWLFGHKIWSDIYTGRTAQITNFITGDLKTVPVVRPKRNEVCPRCDVRIKNDHI